MARFFFHLRDYTDELLDPDGVEFDSLEASKTAALVAARDTLSQEMKAGVLDLRYRIDVEDQTGALVHSVALGDAFRIVRT